MTVAEGGVLATRCPAMSGQCVVEALWSTWALCAGHHHHHLGESGSLAGPSPYSPTLCHYHSYYNLPFHV